MSDFLRLFLILVCMYLSFQLGKNYALRQGVSELMNYIHKACDELTRHAAEAPAPNETID